MSETREIKPIFRKDLFYFEHSIFVPDHYEEHPKEATLGLWAVVGFSKHHADASMCFASDVVSQEQAELLFRAKERYFDDPFVYGTRLDIAVLDPQHTVVEFIDQPSRA